MLTRRAVTLPSSGQCRQLIRGSSPPFTVPRHRQYSQDQHGIPGSPPSRRRYMWFIGSATTVILGLELYKRKVKADASRIEGSKAERHDNPLAVLPFPTLLRSYFVYTCCGIPFLVDFGPSVVDWCRKTTIPGVWSCFEFVVRNTFFPQFVGGETVEECVGRMKELSESSVGIILNYSAETTEEKMHKIAANDADDTNSKICLDKVEAILHSIQTIATCVESGNSTRDELSRNSDSVLVAVKLSGLIKDASVLERASAVLVSRELFSEPPTTTPPSQVRLNDHGPCANLKIPISSLTQHDVDSLRQLWLALQEIAAQARRNGMIRVLIDAEYSWYQPAIDALYESCAQQYNQIPPRESSSLWWPLFGRERREEAQSRFEGPLVYNTLQAYLRRTPFYLATCLEKAKRGNYSLGIKLVRGAYVDQENAEWNTKSVPAPPAMGIDGHHLSSPVWPSKDKTDDCYNACTSLLIRRVAEDLDRTEGNPDFAPLGIVLAGHNWTSNMNAIQAMIDDGLASEGLTAPSLSSASCPFYQLQLRPRVRGRIHFAQLYGMADELTRAIQTSFDRQSGGAGPHIVLKYIPYGNLDLVMPYLMRRAVENKSVMGGGTAKKEKRILEAEMVRRLLSWL
ncbi:hypothetical protein CBS101457_001894 [Exobasidium rhododendri]|nr:hypothetical protein CBS101457_001894 [Exobasidium rhododendri]